jgi:predicted ArsR family transcriptional regulator
MERMPADPRNVDAIALLAEPARRTLYDWVVAAGRPVSRDEAAAGAGVSRALAAFHLDRLVQAGLLTPEYRRLSGRTGPGAGRPAKLYARAPAEVAVSLPERSYEVAAKVFADALTELAPSLPPDAVTSSARALGEDVGAEARRRAGPRPGARRRREALLTTLFERGYEPRETEDGEIRLGNCPFHALVEDHRPLVCGMNLALAEGVVAGLGDDRVEPRLDPQPGSCCVAFGARDSA